MAKSRKNKISRRSRKQRVYNMKGCSTKKHYKGGAGCGSASCPIAAISTKQMNEFRGGCGGTCNNSHILGIGQTGGQCSSCNCNSMKGGSFYKTDLPPVPSPFVGKPWGPLVSEWPGVDGISSGRNFFTNNLYNKGDPQTMMKLGGWGLNGGGGSMKRGKRGKKGRKGKGKKGGAFLSDFVGLGRDLTYNFQSTYNSLNGYQQPMNPKPYIQPSLSSVNPKI